jgi:RNA polymerase sigma-70 factor (ECF subfamily)
MHLSVRSHMLVELVFPSAPAYGLPVHPARAYCNPVTPRDEPSCDEDLMLAYRDGNPAAFDELYRRHKAPLYRYLLRQCRDAAVAEDLFQDIWANVVRSRGTYAVSARFTTYLYCLAHNRLIDHYRRRAPAALVSFDDEDAALPELQASAHEQPDRALDVKQQAARLLALLDGLPEAQRESFVLQHEAGMSLEEIAAVTGVTRETAKSRLRYAMAKLRSGMHGWL